MKKSNALIGLIAFVISLGYLQSSTIIRKCEDNNLQQVGAAAIIRASIGESNNTTWATAGGIIGGTGVGMLQASVPNGWNPVGWYGIGIGLTL